MDRIGEFSTTFYSLDSLVLDYDTQWCIHPIRNDFLLYRKLTNQSARFGHTPDIPTFFTAFFTEVPMCYF